MNMPRPFALRARPPGIPSLRTQSSSERPSSFDASSIQRKAHIPVAGATTGCPTTTVRRIDCADQLLAHYILWMKNTHANTVGGDYHVRVEFIAAFARQFPRGWVAVDDLCCKPYIHRRTRAFLAQREALQLIVERGSMAK